MGAISLLAISVVIPIINANVWMNGSLPKLGKTSGSIKMKFGTEMNDLG